MMIFQILDCLLALVYSFSNFPEPREGNMINPLRYNDHKITKIDLLKIDVETHEPEVLEGYTKYIHLHKPTMLIEILNDEL